MEGLRVAPVVEKQSSPTGGAYASAWSGQCRLCCHCAPSQPIDAMADHELQGVAVGIFEDGKGHTREPCELSSPRERFAGLCWNGVEVVVPALPRCLQGLTA